MRSTGNRALSTTTTTTRFSRGVSEGSGGCLGSWTDRMCRLTRRMKQNCVLSADALFICFRINIPNEIRIPSLGALRGAFERLSCSLLYALQIAGSKQIGRRISESCLSVAFVFLS